MEKPLISVIVPVYNAEKYLDRCVDSIVGQTYDNLEIILVDDGSTDHCPQICDGRAEKDNRVKVIHNENRGAMHSRLDGVKHAGGEYIMFVDSDDWIDADICSYLYHLLIENDAQISCADIRSVNETNADAHYDNIEQENIKVYNFVQIFKSISEFPFWSLCGKLYKKELFADIPFIEKRITFSEDMMYNYFLYKHTEKAVTTGRKKYFYFNHCESAIAGELNYALIDDSMFAYELIDEDFDKTSEAYEYQVINKIKNDFFLINSVLRNNKCLDRYDLLRKDIFKYLKLVSKENLFLFNKQQRIGLKLLKYCPYLYNKSILIRKKLRGY